MPAFQPAGGRRSKKGVVMARAAAKKNKEAVPATHDVAAILRELEADASSQYRADMSARYGIVTSARVLGTPMAKLKLIARKLGKSHDLAEMLWKTGVHDARMLTALIGEPDRATPTQMHRWVRDSDNWALVDTLAMHLFDRTPHALAQIEKWSKSKHEFVRRAAFALLASVALHGRATDADLLRALPLIERASDDARNFVKKSVNWALRAIGRRKNPKVRAAARALAETLAASDHAAARWIGKDALRAFSKQA
jgi:3-methyladenine DNA glycosylase AlkD